MRRLLLSLSLFSAALTLIAQENNILQVKNDSANVFLESVSIDITIIGNIATTVTELTFFNPNDRVLEGELNFPLGDNQSVHRFAMDVNGKLREGVIVEKAQGRKAFEGVVRKAVDPGLLEQTVGNNYKARVYPIPAEGRKSILIGYEEVIDLNNPIYSLIVDYKTVKNFNLGIEIVNEITRPKFEKNDLVTIEFDSWNNSLIAKSKKTDFNASGALSFILPITNETKVYRGESTSYDYFYTTVSPKVQLNEKKLPGKIDLFWDTSLSMSDRDSTREFKLLRQYFQKNSSASIRLVKFSNAINEIQFFQIEKGNINPVLESLRSTIYDGGTSYQSLQLDQLKTDEVFLFTDGVSNLDKLLPREMSIPIFTINSSPTSNVNLLSFIGENSQGSYLNLLTTSIEDCIAKLSTAQYGLLGITQNNKTIFDVTTVSKTVSDGRSYFSLVGKIKNNKSGEIALDFGNNGNVTETVTLLIPNKINATSLDRIWAVSKVRKLLMTPEFNKEEIISLAKEFNLITPFTSLIILEDVRDYVRYDITPPSELLEEYSRIKKSELAEVKSSQKNIVASLLQEYEERSRWWENDEVDHSVYVEKEESSNDNSTRLTIIIPDQNNASIEIDNEEIPTDSTNNVDIPVIATPNQPSSNNITVAPGNKIVSGKITSIEDGSGLPGVNVVLKGSTSGTVTDLNGNYQLSVPEEGATLIYSFIGLSTEEIPVNSRSLVDVQMSADVQQLSEVVVTAMGVQRETLALGYATTLQGKAAGVRITPADPFTANVMIRNTIPESPLIIIDGEVSNSDEYAQLNPTEVASSYFLNGEDAIEIYGNRGKDGVIFISTNYGVEDGYVLPDSIIQMTNPKYSTREWNYEQTYLEIIKSTAIENQYDQYLQLRSKYLSTPSFYLSVGDYFLATGREELGLRILSNIVEIELENHELLKTLARRYSQEEMHDNSLLLFKRILDLRPEEPQSKRDLAIAYREASQFQKALDLYLDLLLNEIEDFDDLFPQLESILLYEMNHLISQHKKKLNLDKVPKELILKMPVDIRILLDWNTLDTDLDLWVIEPTGEKCYYENHLTTIGGTISEDFIDGYGPEEYVIKKALKGDYQIKVDYFDEREQKISGPVTLFVTIFKNYGRKNETKEELTLLLETEEDTINVGAITW